MIDRLLDLVAPHICCSCGQQNAILCENCYFDIKDEPFSRCVDCMKPCISGNLCTSCRENLGLDDVWVVGERTEALKQLVNQYKFERVKQAGDVIAHLLADRLPVLPQQTVICYIPDIAAHRRQRGYDHMAYIAKQLAKLRGMRVIPLLNRRTHVSQRNLSRKDRLRSQAHAFVVHVHPKQPVLLLDDIYTTGATLRAATHALRDAGTETVYGAIVARQPLDEMRDL